MWQILDNNDETNVFHFAVPNAFRRRAFVELHNDGDDVELDR